MEHLKDVENVLDSDHTKVRGFNITDAAQLVLILEQLIFDAESDVLERVYIEHGRSSVDSERLGQILEHYVVYWMMAGSGLMGLKLMEHLNSMRSPMRSRTLIKVAGRNPGDHQ